MQNSPLNGVAEPCLPWQMNWVFTVLEAKTDFASHSQNPLILFELFSHTRTDTKLTALTSRKPSAISKNSLTKNSNNHNDLKERILLQRVCLTICQTTYFESFQISAMRAQSWAERQHVPLEAHWTASASTCPPLKAYCVAARFPGNVASNLQRSHQHESRIPKRRFSSRPWGKTNVYSSDVSEMWRSDI